MPVQVTFHEGSATLGYDIRFSGFFSDFPTSCGRRLSPFIFVYHGNVAASSSLKVSSVALGQGAQAVEGNLACLENNTSITHYAVTSLHVLVSLFAAAPHIGC